MPQAGERGTETPGGSSRLKVDEMIEEIQITTKYCRQCNKDKPLSSFHPSSLKAHFGLCIDCISEWNTCQKDNLADTYIVNQVLLKCGKLREEITPEMIEGRRSQIKAKRLVDKLFSRIE